MGKYGRPKVSEQRQCLCVWIKSAERDALIALASQYEMSISALARRMIIYALDGDTQAVVSIEGLAKSSSPTRRFKSDRVIVAKPIRSRLYAVQKAHENRARKIGAEWECVDLAKLFEREAGLCGVCRQSVDFSDFTVDHVVPMARGGGHVSGNIQLAHRACNSRKGVNIPTV